MAAGKTTYLIPGRLEDVLALIQVLALDKHAHRSEEHLQEELQGIPASSDKWSSLASAHPEFFRVTKGEHPVSLIARHVTPRNAQNEREPLDADLLKQLLEMAVSIHDRQVQRSQKWVRFMPVYSAVIGAIVAGALALVKPSDGKKETEQPSRKEQISQDAPRIAPSFEKPRPGPP